MARLLALTQSVRFGGDDTVLLDLIRAWPAGDSWTVALNRSHPGLSVYQAALASRAVLIALDIPADGEPGSVGALEASRRLLPIIERASPDAVLVSSGGFPPTPLTVGFLLAAWRAGAPRIVLAAHNEPNLGSGLRAAWRGLRGWAATRFCDALVSVSADCAGKISSACGRPVRAILNGSSDYEPTEDSSALRAELGVPPGAYIVGTIANLEARKGLRVLIEAFAQLSQPNARLVIIGAEADPAEAAALKILAAAPALSGRVLLAGRRPNARRFAAIFDVCVVPSLRQESFGLLALDAMLAARPVVVSRVGGLPEVVEDGVTGIHVPPGEPAALAAALERLIADPALAQRLGAAGRRRAAALFSAERMASEYRKVLLGVVK